MEHQERSARLQFPHPVPPPREHSVLPLQHCPDVSNLLRLVLLADLHLRAALDLSVLVGGNAPVRPGIGLRHLNDLHPGVLALVVDGDATTGGDLPPFTLHPLHAGDGIASNLCDEGGGALCRRKDAVYVLRRENIDSMVLDKQTPGQQRSTYSL